MQEINTKNDESNLPVTLWLQGITEPLLKQELLRMIPHKRWVISALWGEQKVVAKIFAKLTQAQRELRNVQMLQNAGIVTPSLLFHGWAKNYPFYVLIYQKIEQAQDVAAVWWSLSQTQQLEVLKKLIQETATLHQAGFKQDDLHLKNFLLKEEKIFVIDTAEITRTSNSQALDQHAGIKNLALLIAQVAPRFDKDCDNFQRLYTSIRRLIFTLTGVEELKKWIGYWRRRHLAIYSKKVFRTTSQIICRKSWKEYTVCLREYDTQAMRDLLANPDAMMQSPEATVLKAGNTSTVVLVEIDGQPFVIKRYNIKSFWHGLKRLFRRSRAALCWRNSMCLASWQLGVVPPVAMKEKRFGRLRRQAYFITRYLPGMSLQELITGESYSAEEQEIITQKMNALFADLASIWVTHGDLKANNIIFVEGQPVLLDLDAMRIHRFYRSWRKASAKDHKRYLKNWPITPNAIHSE